MTDPVTIEQVTADFSAYAGHVTDKVAAVTAANVLLQQELTDALNNGGSIPADLQTAINNLDTAVLAADTAITSPPVPVPEPPVV